MATDIIARGMITEYKSGTNISFTENDDGSVTISASGNVSSEDSVARDAINNHKSDTSNPHNVTPAQIGLGNVDNTADLDKPISTAVQTALNGKVDKIDVKDNLESTDTTSPLSANQGKVLNKKITEHTDDSDIHVTASDKENWNSHPNDVTATGNPVQLDGLQGGVPFSEMAVSGKNLIGIAQAKELTGDNKNGFLVFDNSASRSIIQKLQPNTTYHIKKYDSGNRFRIVMFDDEPTNTADVNAQQLIYNTDGSISDYTLSTGDNHLWMALATHYATSGEAIEPIVQLEYGDTATEYEPPITGRELTVGVSGKNLIPYPYQNTNTTHNGVTFTVNNDGSIIANGTATENATFTLWDLTHKFAINSNETYTLSGCPFGGSNTTFALYNIGTQDIDYGDGKTFTEKSDYAPRITIYKGYTANNLVFRPQLEIGDTATEYEPYHGSTVTITPDSNPYTVPNDIRQQDGLNVVSVSEGELSVTGVRKNAAIKKIWDKMCMDLLFDGVTSADNPAVIDLANYKFVEIHHIMIANEKAYPSNIRLSLDSYLSSASTISTPISNSTINTIHTEEGTVSSLYAISAAGSNINNTKIYGIK